MEAASLDLIASPEDSTDEPSSLAALPLRRAALVRALRLRPDEAAWLRAVGIFEGQRVAVLRRAPFGGPLQVRTASGASFAVDRALAAAIDVAPVELAALAGVTETP